MQSINNVPVSCMYCGYMVHGQESSTKVHNGIINECTWRCTKCGQVTKREDEFIKDEEK